MVDSTTNPQSTNQTQSTTTTTNQDTKLASSHAHSDLFIARKKRRLNSHSFTIPNPDTQPPFSSKIFNDLKQLEYKLDLAIEQKRLGVEQLLQKQKITKANAEIYVSCQILKRTERTEYKFNIQAHMFNPITHEQINVPFTSLASKLIVLFPKNLQPIEWKRSPGFVDCDGWVFSQTTSNPIEQPFIVQIQLHLLRNPALYQTSKPLTLILEGDHQVNGKHGRSRTLLEVASELWNYIRHNQLQDDSDTKLIQCDTHLKAITHCDSLTIHELFARVKEHLIPQEPIQLEYQINPFDRTNNDHEQLFVHQVAVALDNDLLESFTTKLEHQVASINKDIEEHVEQIRIHQRKRDHMVRFANNPTETIYEILCEQTHHLRMVNNRLDEEARFSSFWQQDWVQEALQRELNQSRSVE